MGRSKQRVTARANVVSATCSSFVSAALSACSSLGRKAQHDLHWAGWRGVVGHIPDTRHEAALYDLLWDEVWPRQWGPSDTQEWSKPRKESSRAAKCPQGSMHLEILFPIVLGFARLHKLVHILETWVFFSEMEDSPSLAWLPFWSLLGGTLWYKVLESGKGDLY